MPQPARQSLPHAGASGGAGESRYSRSFKVAFAAQPQPDRRSFPHASASGGAGEGRYSRLQSRVRCDAPKRTGKASRMAAHRAGQVRPLLAFVQSRVRCAAPTGPAELPACQRIGRSSEARHLRSSKSSSRRGPNRPSKASRMPAHRAGQVRPLLAFVQSRVRCAAPTGPAELPACQRIGRSSEARHLRSSKSSSLRSPHRPSKASHMSAHRAEQAKPATCVRQSRVRGAAPTGPAKPPAWPRIGAEQAKPATRVHSCRACAKPIHSAGSGRSGKVLRIQKAHQRHGDGRRVEAGPVDMPARQ